MEDSGSHKQFRSGIPKLFAAFACVINQAISEGFGVVHVVDMCERVVMMAGAWVGRRKHETTMILRKMSNGQLDQLAFGIVDKQTAAPVLAEQGGNNDAGGFADTRGGK